ncbi:MAG: hypothetical protein E7310_06330 [Clostridiales bacterium]|nr:hypothetical protein [Clostridiales bacterium]
MEVKFRDLREDEIECRVANITANGVSLLLYKTARTDMDILDETVGATNWKCAYQEVKSNMYCGLSIFDKDKTEWITKWDCGKESFSDAEKGEASDAFKRAGFKWGIGRELYTAPFIWVSSNNCTIEQKNNKFICKDSFEVSKIVIKDKKIVQLEIAVKGKVIYQYSKEIKENNTDEYITKEQQKKLFTLANNNNEIVKNVINRYKYEKTNQIKTSDFEQICVEIESEVLM